MKYFMLNKIPDGHVEIKKLGAQDMETIQATIAEFFLFLDFFLNN